MAVPISLGKHPGEIRLVKTKKGVKGAAVSSSPVSGDTMLSNSQNQLVFPNQQQQQQQQALQHLQFHARPALQIKKNAITDDYKITNQVLGLGINGRVLEIVQKKNGEKYALKVRALARLAKQLKLSVSPTSTSLGTQANEKKWGSNHNESGGTIRLVLFYISV